MRNAILIVCLVCGLLGLNVIASKLVVDHEIDQFSKTLVIPQLMTVDLDKMVSDKLEQGIEPKKILAYTDTVLELLRHDGFIVLDSKNVLYSPERHNLRDITFEELDVLIKDRGIEPLEDQSYQQSLDDSLKHIEDTFDISTK